MSFRTTPLAAAVVAAFSMAVVPSFAAVIPITLNAGTPSYFHNTTAGYDSNAAYASITVSTGGFAGFYDNGVNQTGTIDYQFTVTGFSSVNIVNFGFVDGSSPAKLLANANASITGTYGIDAPQNAANVFYITSVAGGSGSTESIALPDTGTHTLNLRYTIKDGTTDRTNVQLFYQYSGQPLPFTVTGQFAPTPEPASLGLLAAGAAGLFIRRRRN